MAKRETLIKVEFIVDHDCGNYTIGEIDNYPDDQIKAYLDRFGTEGHKNLNNFFDRCKAVVWNYNFEKQVQKMNESIAQCEMKNN